MTIRRGQSGGGALGGRVLSNNGSLRQLVIAAGFKGNAVDMAQAIAMAESSGNAQAINANSDGSEDRGLFQINNRYHSEVSDACAFDPLCCAKAAYRISNGGTDWSPWSTYQNGAYQRYLKPGADYRFTSNAPINAALTDHSGTVSGTAGGTSDSGGGGGPSLSFGGLFTLAASDVASFVFDAFIKFPAVLIGDYLIVPAWHWNQRAVMYYYDTYITGDTTGTSTLATAAFWGLGYVLLWGDPDAKGIGNKLRQRVPHRQSRIARHIRQAQAIPEYRKLTKPGDVKRVTATKPKPRISHVTLTHVGTMHTHRAQRVKVTGSGVHPADNIPVAPENPKETEMLRNSLPEGDPRKKRPHGRPRGR